MSRKGKPNPPRDESAAEERAAMVAFLRDQAEKLRNDAAKTRAGDQAAAWNRQAAFLGRIANQLERGEHVR